MRTTTIDITRKARLVPGSIWWTALPFRLHAQIKRTTSVNDSTSAMTTAEHQTELAGSQQQAPPATADQHDEPHFEEFFRRYQPDIFGYLWRITTEEQVAYDLCQETFLRAWQHFGKVSVYEQPGAWLFRVATNLALNHQRDRSSHRDKPLQLDEYASGSTDPAHRIVERDAVAAVLLELPPRQRMALVLRVVYGMPFEEIAAALGVSLAAAKMTLSRAREQFRRRYLEIPLDQDGKHEAREMDGDHREN